MTDNPRQSRYEIVVDGEPAGFVAYDRESDDAGDIFALTHTEIDPRFEGQGLGGRLIGQALDDLRERGARLLPYCSFVKSYLERHDEYVDLVPEDRRARFGLTSGD